MRAPRAALVALAVAWALPAAPAHAAGAPARPHILLLVADDLGWNDVGYHGSEIRTPHIDALARRGVVLERFYAFPTCTPTRVALHTGRSPLTLGLHGPLEPERRGVPAEVPMLAEILRDAGYQTALVGKWHMGSNHVREWPLRRGYESFYGNLTGGIGYWDKVHRGGYDWMRGDQTLREEGYATHLIADEAVRVLRERDPARPLFLNVSFTAPHVPNEAPPEAVAAYAHVADPHRRLHAASTHELDAAVGRVLAALEAEGLAGDTLVVFLSDNGGATRASFPAWLRFLLPHFDEYASDNAPLRGGKTDVFEGGIRVPAVFWWGGRLEGGHPAAGHLAGGQPAAGHLAGGREVAARVSALDVLPTLAEAIGLPLGGDSGLQGESRWAAICGEVSPPPQDLVVGNMGSLAYFRGRWKLVKVASPLPFVKRSGTFLFDVQADPGETRNRAGERPEKVAELEAALSRFPIGPSDFVLPRPWEYGSLFGGRETRRPWAETAERGEIP